MPKVGIFFKINYDYLSDAVSLTDGEPYGDAIEYSGHYDFHENFDPFIPSERRFKAHDYDYYPRGRVVYFPKRNTFTLYTDPCLTAEGISRIICLFDLDGQTVEIAGHEHYRCSPATNPIWNRPPHSVH